MIIGDADEPEDVGRVIGGTGRGMASRGSKPTSAGNVNSVRDRVRKMQGMAEVAKGIEALEAVAAMASSSGRTSAKLVSASRDGDRRGYYHHHRRADRRERVVSPSEAPSAADRRSTGRGMAALSVAGSRRTLWGEDSSSSSGIFASSNGNKGLASVSATAAACPSSRSLVRTPSDGSTSSGHERIVRGISDSSSQNNTAAAGGFVVVPPDSSRGSRRTADISPSSSCNSFSADESRLAKPAAPANKRDSIGVHRQSLLHSSKKKNKEKKQHQQQAPSTTTTTATGSKSKSSRSSPRAHAAGAGAASSSAGRAATKAFTGRESFTPRNDDESRRGNGGGVGGVVVGQQARSIARGWWMKRTGQQELSNNLDHHETAAAAAVVVGEDEGAEKNGILGEEATITTTTISTGKAIDSSDSSVRSPLGIRVENAELRLESQRLEMALAAAKVMYSSTQQYL